MQLDYGVIVQTVAFFLAYLFPLWPLMVLAPLQRRRHVLFNMTMAWFVMGIWWLITLLAPTQPRSFLIPEPWNTVAFFITGVVLIGFQLWQKLRQRLHIRGKLASARTAEDLHALSPTEFESMVVELYSSLGHHARRTGRVGDHGVDVEVHAKIGEKWVIQCKRWRGAVGEPIIRDFYGVMHHEKADRGAIVTPGAFTEQARQWAKGKPIELIDGEEYMRMLKRARQTSMPKTQVA